MHCIAGWKGVLLSVIVCAGAGFGGVGCASSSYGTKMDTTKVSQIQKGFTTRAQVEEMFGPPANVSLMGDGRRMMNYTYIENDTKVKGTTFIPYAGMFMGGSKGTTRTQNLQVILSSNDVVQDYVMNDGTSATDFSSNPFATRMSTTPTNGAASAAPAAGR